MQPTEIDILTALHAEARHALDIGVPLPKIRRKIATLYEVNSDLVETPLHLETYIMVAVAGRVRPARANGRMGRLKAVRAAEGQPELFDTFEAFINRCLGGVKLTAHGYTTTQLSDADPDQLFAAILDLVRTINDLGYEVFANSGTLLGIVRDKAPIPYDNDIDLAIILNATDDLSAAGEFAALFETLRSAAFADLGRTGDGRIIKLPKIAGFEVDLFPAYDTDAGFSIYPYSYRDLVKSDILPLGKCSISGLPIPARCETVLEVNYGKTWKTPERHFAFPWGRQDAKFATFLGALR
jgi:hypothetical protein